MEEDVFEFSKSLQERAETKTPIPGHPYLGEDQYKSDDFIAMMIDMRDSTKHLRQSIGKPAKVSQMERVFYEVSGLLPALAKIIEYEEGAVTEYLGDGLLALFQFSEDNDNDKKKEIIYSASIAARDCISMVRGILNPILEGRYYLPPIQIGVGVAFSKAIITRFGLPPNTQVKVIGQCIYFASRLSKGRDEIIVHEWLENIWPSTKDGRIRFSLREFENKTIKGYLLEEK